MQSRYQTQFNGFLGVDTGFEINVSYVGQQGTGSCCAGERVVTHDQEDTYTRTYTRIQIQPLPNAFMEQGCKHAWKLVRNCYGSMRDVFVKQNLSIINSIQDTWQFQQNFYSKLNYTPELLILHENLKIRTNNEPLTRIFFHSLFKQPYP